MVSRKQLQRILKIASVIGVIAGLVYVGLAVASVLPFRTYFPLGHIYEIGSPAAVIESGDNESARYDDGNLLNLSHTLTEIAVRVVFDELENSTPVGEYVRLRYWLEMEVRASKASSSNGASTVTSEAFPIRGLGGFTTSTTFSIVRLYVGTSGEGEGIILILFVSPSNNFFIEIDYITLYYEGLSLPQAMLQSGIVLACLVGLVGSYYLLRWRGYFNINGRALLDEINYELYKLQILNDGVSDASKK